MCEKKSCAPLLMETLEERFPFQRLVSARPVFPGIVRPRPMEKVSSLMRKCPCFTWKSLGDSLEVRKGPSMQFQEYTRLATLEHQTVNNGALTPPYACFKAHFQRDSFTFFHHISGTWSLNSRSLSRRWSGASARYSPLLSFLSATSYFLSKHIFDMF